MNFRQNLFRYIEKNPQKKLMIEDEELLKIYKQLEKDDIKAIFDNPEIFFLFIEEELNNSETEIKKDEKKNNKGYINEDKKIQEEDDEDENENEKNMENVESNKSLFTDKNNDVSSFIKNEKSNNNSNADLIIKSDSKFDLNTDNNQTNNNNLNKSESVVK